MRMIHLLPALASAALLLSGTAALAQQTAPASTTAEESGGAAPAPAAKPKKERKICRDNANSYSHMGGRVCKTQVEWDNGPQTREMDSHVQSADPNH
jgi:hypothetical protein